MKGIITAFVGVPLLSSAVGIGRADNPVSSKFSEHRVGVPVSAYARKCSGAA